MWPVWMVWHLPLPAEERGMKQALRIDVWFDLICPWCLIGHRQLQAALHAWRQLNPDGQVDVHWHSVQLLPDVPPQGWPFAAFYTQRLGGEAAVQARQAQVLAAAQAAGASMRFDRIQTFPNSAAAHHLYQQSRQWLTPDAHDGLLCKLFAAYFEHGHDLNNPQVLRELGRSAGVPESALQLCLEEAPSLEPCEVPGVPFFLINRRHGLSGAQSPQALLAAMTQA